jgi:hypothetical protein
MNLESSLIFLVKVLHSEKQGITISNANPAKRVSCYHGMTWCQVSDYGGDYTQIWRIDANILKKKPTRGGSPV